MLSFDTTVSLSGAVLDDADLARFGGTGFTPVFDSAAAGVPAGLDLDAAHMLADGTLRVSFDTSGNFDAVAFDDLHLCHLPRHDLGQWDDLLLCRA